MVDTTLGVFTPAPVNSPQYSFNAHDLKVVAFQCGIAALIAIISYLGNLHFGVYSPIIYSLLMALGEALRRFVI